MFSKCLIAVFAAVFSAVATAQDAGAAPTIEEAVALAFPDAVVERKVQALTAAEVEATERVAEVSGIRATVFAYEARREGRLVGTAYVDTHRVRTHAAKLLIAIDAAGMVARIEVLQFDEPAEYLPRSAFYSQFVGKKLDDELRVKRAIRGVTGATLTTRATVDAVRRVLAVHATLSERDGVKAREGKEGERGDEAKRDKQEKQEKQGQASACTSPSSGAKTDGDRDVAPVGEPVRRT